VRVHADHDGASITAEPAFFRSGASDAEFFDAQLRAPLLRRIAGETGGRYYTIDALNTLPEDIGYTGRGVRQVEEKELFDMPILFFMLVGLLGGEWLFRRSRGLA
jgi:hypothetical protein